eukprot:5707351-Pleurochrysis_carterae.AAC.1
MRRDGHCKPRPLGCCSPVSATHTSKRLREAVDLDAVQTRSCCNALVPASPSGGPPSTQLGRSPLQVRGRRRVSLGQTKSRVRARHACRARRRQARMCPPMPH